MTFSSIKVLRHLEKWDSGGIKYDLGYKHANNNMRSDCLLNSMKKLAKCKKGYEPPESLLRMRHIFMKNLEHKPKNCNILRDKLTRYHKQCQMTCRMDCRFTYYILDLNQEH